MAAARDVIQNQISEQIEKTADLERRVQKIEDVSDLRLKNLEALLLDITVTIKDVQTKMIDASSLDKFRLEIERYFDDRYIKACDFHAKWKQSYDDHVKSMLDQNQKKLSILSTVLKIISLLAAGGISTTAIMQLIKISTGG